MRRAFSSARAAVHAAVRPSGVASSARAAAPPAASTTAGVWAAPQADEQLALEQLFSNPHRPAAAAEGSRRDVIGIAGKGGRASGDADGNVRYSAPRNDAQPPRRAQLPPRAASSPAAQSTPSARNSFAAPPLPASPSIRAAATKLARAPLRPSESRPASASKGTPISAAFSQQSDYQKVADFYSARNNFGLNSKNARSHVRACLSCSRLPEPLHADAARIALLAAKAWLQCPRASVPHAAAADNAAPTGTGDVDWRGPFASAAILYSLARLLPTVVSNARVDTATSLNDSATADDVGAVNGLSFYHVYREVSFAIADDVDASLDSSNVKTKASLLESIGHFRYDGSSVPAADIGRVRTRFAKAAAGVAHEMPANAAANALIAAVHSGAVDSPHVFTLAAAVAQRAAELDERRAASALYAAASAGVADSALVASLCAAAVTAIPKWTHGVSPARALYASAVLGLDAHTVSIFASALHAVAHASVAPRALSRHYAVLSLWSCAVLGVRDVDFLRALVKGLVNAGPSLAGWDLNDARLLLQAGRAFGRGVDSVVSEGAGVAANAGADDLIDFNNDVDALMRDAASLISCSDGPSTRADLKPILESGGWTVLEGERTLLEGAYVCEALVQSKGLGRAAVFFDSAPMLLRRGGADSDGVPSGAAMLRERLCQAAGVAVISIDARRVGTLR